MDNKDYNLKEVKALLKLLKANGVTEFSGFGLSMKINEVANSQSSDIVSEESKPAYTDEELLTWSVGQNI